MTRSDLHRDSKGSHKNYDLLDHVVDHDNEKATLVLLGWRETLPSVAERS